MNGSSDSTQTSNTRKTIIRKGESTVKINRCNTAKLTATLLFIIFALATNNVSAMSQNDDQATMISPKTYRLIVKYRDSETRYKRKRSSSSISQSLSQTSGTQLKVLHSTATNAHVVQLDRLVSMTEAKDIADQIAMDPDVLYAEPDGMIHAYSVPNDPLYRNQWHYFNPAGGLNLPNAWDVSTGKDVVVAVIDSGIRPHADLQNKVLPGYDFISNAFIANDGGLRDNDASDPGDWMEKGVCGGGEPFYQRNSSWHGTHVAGTIAASGNNGIGVSGVAWGAKILPIRVLGKCGGFESDAADAMLWAAGLPVLGVPNNLNPAKVINLSAGEIGPCPMVFRDAIQAVRRVGVTVVVSAGNDYQNAQLTKPANCPGVIAVGATNFWGERSSYSNFGPTVDVYAPGGEGVFGFDGILSTVNSGITTPGGDGYAYLAGTSMAAPHVSGVVALMYALQPNITPTRVENILKQTVRARSFAFPCPFCNGGIVDATAAVNRLKASFPAALSRAGQSNR